MPRQVLFGHFTSVPYGFCIHADAFSTARRVSSSVSSGAVAKAKFAGDGQRRMSHPGSAGGCR